MLDLAWKYILDAHPHDSINGVTQDKTADDTENRLRQAIELGEVVVDKQAGEIIKMIDFSSYEKTDDLLVVFNSTAYERSEIIKVCIDTNADTNTWEFEITDCGGEKCPVQSVSKEEKCSVVHDLDGRPWPKYSDRHICHVEIGKIPSFGYKTLKITKTKPFKRNHYYWVEMRKSLGMDICSSDNVLENEFLKLEVNSNGTIDLFNKQNNTMLKELNYFEDTGDTGNYWAYYPPYSNKTYTTKTVNANVWLEDNGPLSATIAAEITLMLPAYAREVMCGVKGQSSRSSELAEQKITSYYTLQKGSKRVGIKTVINNKTQNHRMRAVFPTNINASVANASGHFTVDNRNISPVCDSEGKHWPEMNTLPMQHFININDEKNGMAIVSNSLTEYEVKNICESTVYLTLFRAMGNLIVTSWECVGVFPEQKGSQLLREMTFEYGIYPYEGSFQIGDVYEQAEQLNVPLSYYQVIGGASGSLAPENSFLEIEDKRLILSAFKKSEDDDSYILRLFNPEKTEINSKIKFEMPFMRAQYSNLNETSEKEIQIKDKTVSVSSKSNQIITIKLDSADA